MELVQGRIVTEHVEAMAGFYAVLIGTPVALNDYYVEVPTGPVSLGFSRCRFTEDHTAAGSGDPRREVRAGEMILDFVVDDVDDEYDRIRGLGVEWLSPPTTQPWGKRSMLLRDPEGHLVTVFSRRDVQ